MNPNKRHLSWATVDAACDGFINEMCRDSWCPDLIVGITRGGLVPAVTMSHRLDVPMITVDIKKRDHVESSMPNVVEVNYIVDSVVNKGWNILVVDEINDTGTTLNTLVDDLFQSGLPSENMADFGKVRMAVIINKESSDCTVEYSHMDILPDSDDLWWVFPWEYDKR